MYCLRDGDELPPRRQNVLSSLNKDNEGGVCMQMECQEIYTVEPFWSVDFGISRLCRLMRQCIISRYGQKKLLIPNF